MNKEKTALFIDRGNGYERLYTEQEVINNLQQRIDKAIEYIKVKARDNCWIDQYEASDLIKILRGDSDE